MVMQILPMSVFAANLQNSTLPNVSVSYGDENISIIQELSDQNTANQKIYLTNNGSVLSITDTSNNLTNTINNNLSTENTNCITSYPEGNSYNGKSKIGNEGEAGYIIQPDLLTLGNIFIENAYITIQCDSILGLGENENIQISVGEIAEDIESDYSNIYTNYASDYVLINNQTSMITLDVTEILNSYLSGSENYGICIFSDIGLESDIEDFSETNEDPLYSNPKLYINYRYLTDVDANIESEIINMDRAGSVYINDFNGAPTVVRNEIGLDGYLAPVQIQSILNPYNNTVNLTGSNFRINYESDITFSENDNCYILNTCEGESLNFSYNKTESSNKIYNAVNSKGETCTLTAPVSNSTDFQNIKVTDADNYEYHFNSYGFLTEILVNGNNSNKIVIEYTTNSESNDISQCRIASITDGSVRKYHFTYDENNRLSNITVKNSSGDTLKINNQDITISYTYNTSGLLNKVTYPDNETAEYTYDSNNRIMTIVSNSGNTLNLSYSANSDLYVISEYILLDSNNKRIENISFNYEEPYRRTLTNKIEKEASGQKVKILDFDKSYSLIYLEDYDNKNYFLDYEDGILKNVINDNPSKNLINNSDFSKNISGWTKITGTSASRQNNPERRLRSDSYALRITGSATKDAGVYQEISGDFKAGEQYIVEAYLSASEAVPLTNNKKMGVAVSTSMNTTGVPVHSDVISQMDYQPYISTWQMQKQVVTIPEDTQTLYVYLYYGYMTGYCYFDSVKLYKYEEEDSSTAIDRTEYTYDSLGRLNKESVTEKTPLLGIVKAVKEKTYTYNGNNLTSITDNGITTYYNYDSSNNLLNSYGTSTDNNKNVNYSYNGIGALESVQQVVNQIDNETGSGLKNMQINTSYAYSHDNVTSITHNGFTYNLSYDGFGNISDVSINDTSLFAYDSQFYDLNSPNRTSQISKVTYGDGTSLIYQEYIDGNYYNVVRIYETKQPNATIENISTGPTYEYRYDYDGTLVEYIDYSNNTVSLWKNNVYAMYNYSEDTESEIYNVIIGNSELSDITEIPIMQYSNDFSGTVLGQSYEQSNIDIFGNSYSTLSTSTYSSSLNRTTTTDRFFYGDIDSIKNIETSDQLNDFLNNNNYTVVKTTTDGFGRTDESSIVSLLDGTGVYNSCSYKDLGSKKTTNLLSEYKTYYGGINTSTQEVDESASLLYRKYQYEYNSNGQISDVYLVSKNLFDESTLNNLGDGITSEKVQHYEYDELGQIIKEVNLKTNRAILYYYDQGGNITERRIYQNSTSDDGSSINNAFTFDAVSNELTLTQCTEDIVYGYNDSSWKDLMTSYNGTNITYDNAGNPLNYSGKNIFNSTVAGTMEWSGKKLVAFNDTQNDKRYEYKYNADGMRTQKKIYSVNSDGSYTPTSAIDYIWDDDLLIGYKMSSYNSNGTVGSFLSVKPLYDGNNNLTGLMYEIPNAAEGEKSKITLPVLRDGLGNVTELYSTLNAVNTMMHYDYDAYGNCVLNFSAPDFSNFSGSGSIIGDIFLAFLYILVLAAICSGTIVLSQQNYRGYLYDMETGLYYNQTRYYSPSWCRFINCDDVNVLTKDTGEVLGANLFKYCDNDPINYTDPSGFSKLSNLYDDSLLSLIGIETTEATKLNIAKTSTQNTIENQIIDSSLALTPQQQEIWSEVFDEKPQTVFKQSGYNYLSSQLNATGNGKSKMYNSKSKTPYDTGTAKNN